MPGNNSIFEFADIFGVNSPFENWVIPPEKGFIKNFDCDFPTLINYIKTNRAQNKLSLFRYKNFQGYKNVTRFYPRHNFVTTREKTINPLIIQSTDPQQKSKELDLSVDVNKKEKEINFRILPRYRFEFNQPNETIKFSLLFQYEKYATEADEDKFAIIISTSNYKDFSDLLAHLNLELTDDSKEDVIKEFRKSFSSDNVKNDANRIDWLYQYAPDFVIAALKSDIALYSDLILLSDKPIDKEGTNENIAVINLLLSFRDKAWFVRKINKDPGPIRKIIANFSESYIPELVLVLTKIGIAVWDQKDIEKARNLYYAFGTTELHLDDDDSSDMHIIGYSEYNKEKNIFIIGFFADEYKKGSFVASETTKKQLGETVAYAPLETLIEGNKFFLPAFVAEYFTNQEIDNNFRLAINNALFFLMPEVSILALKSLTNLANVAKIKIIKSVDELVSFLLDIKAGFKATNLEQYGIKVLFRGTTRNASGKLFQGGSNTIANGISTSTDPIRSTIFAIESATVHGQKGVLQVAIPKKLENVLLLPGNSSVKKELEVILQIGADDFTKLIEVEVSTNDARKIINELFNVDIPSKISPKNAFNNSHLLLADIPKLNLEQSLKFYKSILKLK